MGAGEIPLPQASINPGIMQHPGPQQPDPLSQMLQYFMEAQQQQRLNSNSEAAIEQGKQATTIAQGHLKLAQEQEKTRQAALNQMQSETDQRGKASQAFLKALQPAIEQHAAAHPEVVSQLMGQGAPGSPQAMGGPQAPAQTPMGPPSPVSGQVQSTPAPPPPPQTWNDAVAQMDPASAGAFATEDLPKLLAVKAALEGKPAVPQDMGGYNTIYKEGWGYFDPKKGLPMSDPGAYTPTLQRTMSDDQKENNAMNRAVAEARVRESNSRTDFNESLGLMKAFDTRVKPIRDRAAALNQTLLTLNSAANDPNPDNRKALTSSAVINFIQGADQKAQVRSQIVKYVNDNLDPSMKGWWNKIVARKVEGVLPDYVVAGMLAHIQNLSTLTQAEYAMQRNGEIKRHSNNKALGNFLAEPKDFFMNASAPELGPHAPDQALPPVPE